MIEDRRRSAVARPLTKNALLLALSSLLLKSPLGLRPLLLG